MRILNITVSEKENEIIEAYAEFLGLSVSDFILNSTIEKIEDMIDEASIETYKKNNRLDKNKPDDLSSMINEMESKI